MLKDIFSKNKYANYFLLLIFVSDIMTRIYIYDQVLPSKIIKAIITLIILLVLILNQKKNIIRLILLALICFGIGVYNNSTNFIIENFAQFFKYYSGILFFSFLISWETKPSYNKCLEFIFVFFSINILIAAIFEIQYFKTYHFSERFGYMPLFSSQNEYSFIAITSIIYFYQKVLSNNSLKNLLLLSIAIVTSLMIGTKVVYLFICLWFLYLLFNSFGKVTSVIVISALVLIIFLTQSYWITFLETYFKPFVYLYQEKGLIDVLSSLRISFFEYRFSSQMKDFDTVNYFFGGQDLSLKTEMSLIDIFLFFGIIGGILYFYVYWELVIKTLDLNKISIFYLFSIGIFSFIAGYYFESYSAQIYAVSFLYLYYFKPNQTLLLFS